MTEQHVGTEPETDDYLAGYDVGLADHAAGAELGTQEKTAEWAEKGEEWKRGWGQGYEASATDREVNAYDIEVTDVDVSFKTGVQQGDGPMSLGVAANIAAINLIRVGLDGYDVLYTDTPTGRQWIGRDGAFIAVTQEAKDADSD